MSTVLRLLPVVVGMAAGFAMRRLSVASEADGEFVFKLVFYICLPALMFYSLATTELTRDLTIFLPAAPILVVTGYLAGWLVATRARFTGTQVPVALVALMVVNSGFELPFVQAAHGAEGIARIAVFDIVNTTLTFTWAYHTAARGNPEHQGGGLLVNRLLASPPLYGIAAGLAVNLAGIRLPDPVVGVADSFGSATSILISIGVGILFVPLRGELRKAMLIVTARLVSGLAAGLAIVAIFGFTGVDRTVMLLLAVAPVAFSTVTFSSLENLSLPLATTALSLSLPTSAVLSVAIVLLTN